MLLPSSQVSPVNMSSTPLPQVSSDLQSLLQPSPPIVLPSSQVSPAGSSRTALLHDSSLMQSAAQPSPETSLPSSQTSLPVIVLSPQRADPTPSGSRPVAFGTLHATHAASTNAKR